MTDYLDNATGTLYREAYRIEPLRVYLTDDQVLAIWRGLPDNERVIAQEYATSYDGMIRYKNVLTPMVKAAAITFCAFFAQV